MIIISYSTSSSPDHYSAETLAVKCDGGGGGGGGGDRGAAGGLGGGGGGRAKIVAREV